MKRICGWPLSIVAVALLVMAPAALAQDRGARKKGRGKKRQPVVKGIDYDALAALLELEGEAKAAFDKQVAANNAALEESAKANAAKLKELRAAMKAARKAKNKEKVKAIKAELKQLRGPRATLVAELDAKVLALLTDEQKTAWAGHQFRQQVMRSLRKVELTEDQDIKVIALCTEAAGELGDGKDAKARAVAVKKVRAQIVKEVLTDEQRKALRKGRGRPRKRAKKKKAGAGAPA